MSKVQEALKVIREASRPFVDHKDVSNARNDLELVRRYYRSKTTLPDKEIERALEAEDKISLAVDYLKAAGFKVEFPA